MRLITLINICLFSFSFAPAQNTFRSQASSYVDLRYDSIYKPYRLQDLIVPQKFPGKSFIIPASMIVFGVFAAKTDPTLDINEDIRKKIWIESPHQPCHLDNYLQFVPAVAVYGLNIAGIKGKNNLLDRSMIYIMSSVISNTVVVSLKKITHEQRPDYSDYYSFPSGHTAQAFVSAEFLFQEYKDVSPWYGIAGYGVATSVAFLRMYNNKHWLNDVVAGAGIGIASTRLTYWLYPKIKNLFSRNKPLQTMVMPSYTNGSFGLSMVHVFR